GARPTRCQRVPLANPSCSFLVENGFAFLLGNIEGTPAETTRQRQFTWLMMPPGRAPPLKNFHREVEDRCHALELLRRKEGVHSLEDFRRRAKRNVEGFAGVNPVRSRSIVKISDLIKQPRIASTPGVDRLFRIADVEERPAAAVALDHFAHQIAEGLPLQSAVVLKFIEQPMIVG